MAKLSYKKYGLMFHHFHSLSHKKSQGSISKIKFKKLIDNIGLNNISSPQEFIKGKSKFCITFDDSLKCQYDIALPLLEKLNIKAFWFIYTSSLKPKINNIELFRIFRNEYFKNFDDFFVNFKFFLKNKDFDIFLKTKKNLIKKIKTNFSFYSLNEIKFRILRDNFLKKNEYDLIIKKMYKKFGFKYKKLKTEIFLNKKEIKYLSDNGHEIGLHSHSHPTKIRDLSYVKQFNEYKKNKKILEKITRKKITSASHPSGSYNLNTLKIFNKLGITISFTSTDKIDKKYINIMCKELKIPRIDHVNL